MMYSGVFDKYNSLQDKGRNELKKIKEFYKKLESGNTVTDLPKDKLKNDLNFIAAFLIQEQINKGTLNLDKKRLRNKSMQYLKGSGITLSLEKRNFQQRTRIFIDFLSGYDTSDSHYELLPDSFKDSVMAIRKILSIEKTKYKKRFYKEEKTYGSYGRYSGTEQKGTNEVVFKLSPKCKIWNEDDAFEGGHITLRNLMSIEGSCGLNIGYNETSFKYRLAIKVKGIDSKITRLNPGHLITPAAKKIIWDGLHRLKKQKDKFDKEITTILSRCYKELDKRGYKKYLLLRCI